jgi:dTDP-4-dehydrorhamnose reductase
MRILILGATGMLGNAMVRVLASEPSLSVTGAMRHLSGAAGFASDAGAVFIEGLNVDDVDALSNMFDTTRPDVVINCVGVIKQLDAAKNIEATVPINTLLPHRLARLCGERGARLVHVSTDCVFSGTKGSPYFESDVADARDLYGLSKFLGEVDVPHAITLRTSIIGHELRGGHSLIEWFLAQEGSTRGFTRALFSGLPTVELARVVRDHVLEQRDLAGLYHVSAEPISKYDLLQLVADVYGKRINIEPDDGLVIDRSLDSTRFRNATGCVVPSWPELIRRMHQWR